MKVTWGVLLSVLCTGIIVSSAGKGIFFTEEEQAGKQHKKKMMNENLAVYQAPKFDGELSFAGEEVPLKRFDIRERFDRDMLSNSYFHSNTFLLIKRANRYFPIIEPILKEHGIPDDFKYLAMIESSFDPIAISPAGAAGIWQFMKGTAKDYGLEVNGEVDERYHLKKATVAACAYLKDCYEEFGNWTLVAAAYNRGKAGIAKSVEQQACNNYYDLLLNAETKRYVFRILAMKVICGDPQKYGFYLDASDLYPVIETKPVEVDSMVNDFVSFAKQYDMSYAMLKIFNPWLRDYKLENKEKKTYVIDVPKEENLEKKRLSQKAYESNWVVQGRL